MLGAKARAAEYNAYRAASARQASREAEEQRLPPENVPVSLTAFSKTTIPNRNKGNKTWIPLDLDIIDDESCRSVGNPSQCHTPIQQDSGEIESTSKTVSEHSFDSATNSDIRVCLPNRIPPTAPRAMREKFQTLVTMPAPPAMSIPQDSILHPRNLNTSINSYPPPLPSLAPEWRNGHTLPPPAFSHYDDMNDLDYSPIKQEQKFRMLSKMNQHLFPGHDNPVMNDHHATPLRSSQFDPMHYHQSNAINEHVNQWGNMFSPNGPMNQHNLSGALMTQNQPGQNTHNFVMNSSCSVQPPWAKPPPKVNRAIPIQTPPRVNENEEPYDRSTKMQTFVATQQALAKTGKTVLHNPSLDKSKRVALHGTDFEESIPNQSPVDQDGTSAKFTDKVNRHTAKASKPPPGLGLPMPGHTITAENTLSAMNIEDDNKIRQEFRVGTDEWFNLKSPSVGERKKMQGLMKAVASKARSETEKPVTSQNTHERQSEALRWLHLDPRGLESTRAQFEKIAADLEDANIHVSSHQKERTGQDTDVQAGSLRAMGHVMANLMEEMEDQKLPINERNLFNNYKPAPEFAIDRNALHEFGRSFFEDKEDALYAAPVRFGRDPRFRTEGQEKVQSRFEDLWKQNRDKIGPRKA